MRSCRRERSDAHYPRSIFDRESYAWYGWLEPHLHTEKPKAPHFTKYKERLRRTRRLGLALHAHTFTLRYTGRGVFAAQAIAAGTVVETCPVLIIPPEDVPAAGTTILNHFSYNWPYRDSQGSQRGTTQAIALGLGSIFNHSKNPNVGFRKDVEQEVIVYTSLRDMRPGEELCISYGPRLWFEDVEKDEDEKSEENESTALNGIQVDLQ